jgi:hypothetical protein
MKKIKDFCLVFGLLIISNYSFGQLSKSSCEAMFGELNIKSYEKMRIITNVLGMDQPFYNNSYIDSQSIELTFKEQYLMMKDGTGLIFIIPYDKIKTIEASPWNANKYSSSKLNLLDTEGYNASLYPFQCN